MDGKKLSAAFLPLEADLNAKDIYPVRSQRLSVTVIQIWTVILDKPPYFFLLNPTNPKFIQPAVIGHEFVFHCHLGRNKMSWLQINMNEHTHTHTFVEKLNFIAKLFLLLIRKLGENVDIKMICVHNIEL